MKLLVSSRGLESMICKERFEQEREEGEGEEEEG